ncbi:flagellar protein export ATPase FliI [Vallitalea okinawensis]|uniref:flagellar protein export ATPase FliI n=1 Tax=Vallitalea okinawensis TaxID=2078660 RepID=UPI000CFCA5C2|nr:flagellar protein export ATPase FliI [Vallitalea okinawensis]
MNQTINFDKYYKLLEKDYVRRYGEITRVVGLTIEASGPSVPLGSLCKIKSKWSEDLLAEVVGFKENNIQLMPLSHMSGVHPGSIIESAGTPLSVDVGEQLLGRVLDGLGNPIDDYGDLNTSVSYSISNSAPHPLKRKPIDETLNMGVKAMNGLITIGKGQRVGIFAGSGVGKSTLLGMLARDSSADVNVIALIGERGREVKEFMDKSLGEEGLKRSVVIVATSDQPALVRLKAAYTATAVAEYFRDQGKDVLLMMDSLTRFSMAQREIGLATGEPPVTKGYPPSVFGLMPRLLERAGNSDTGSITGLYTVLVDGDDMDEPISDTARGILDGHIILSRKLAHKNHYPCIDVLQSVSRVMNDIVSPDHKQAASELRNLLATYGEAEDLINIGAYVNGSNPKIDEAISKIDNIKNYLTQSVDENFDYNASLEGLINCIS